jgi:hypothetical protein
MVDPRRPEVWNMLSSCCAGDSSGVPVAAILRRVSMIFVIRLRVIGSNAGMRKGSILIVISWRYQLTSVMPGSPIRTGM